MAQSATCGGADPVCSDLSFPAGTAGGGAGGGNNYGCLTTQPNPAWFWLKPNSDQVDLAFTSNPAVDIDYAMWGPFNSLAEAKASCGGLGSPIQCSYSGNSSESASISGGNGKYYLLLVTNFSGQLTNISVDVSSGSVACISSYAINDVTHNEGNTGTTNYTFTITRTGDTRNASSVTCSTSNGSAAAGSDYASMSQTLSFSGTGGSSGQSQTCTVQVYGDTGYESTESFYLNLSDATGNGQIDDSQGTGTITNDDPLPLVTINDVSVNESSGNATFTVSTSSAVSGGFTINYATSNGTATTADSDYTASSGTLSFSSSDLSKTFTVPVSNDNKVEANETFTVTLSNLQGGTASISDSTGQGTITNDDAATLNVAAASVAEGSALSFTVSLSNPVDTSVSVSASTSNGTATAADSDYSAVSGQAVTFAAGTTSQTVTVTTTDDNKVEANESLTLTVGSLSAGGAERKFRHFIKHRND